jgi:hypothetical protein
MTQQFRQVSRLNVKSQNTAKQSLDGDAERSPAIRSQENGDAVLDISKRTAASHTKRAAITNFIFLELTIPHFQLISTKGIKLLASSVGLTDSRRQKPVLLHGLIFPPVKRIAMHCMISFRKSLKL